MLVDGLPGIDPHRLARGEIGVVRIGVDGVADVTLPSSATDREIKLSCLMLGQIVRLRRERHEDRRIRRVLSHLALSDSLTGLPNRRAWDEELARRTAACAQGGPLVLAVMDVDQFKPINDDHGHLAGDEVLKETARSLSMGVRQDDFVARIGGDEFGILLTNCEHAQAREIVDRVRRSAATDQPRAGRMTLSAGLAVAANADEAAQLFAAADRALCDAKRAGGDCTVEGHFE
jgi:diguanylate cyclase (GGDEF)-like protein